MRRILSRTLLGCAGLGLAAALAADPAGARAAWAQAWPAFAVVVGLLLVGVVADADGVFAAAGGRIAALRCGTLALFGGLLALVAVVTAVLNLDTAVWFLTPVLVHAARARGLDEQPFLLGSVFMANSASLLLPGSNLTNLIVLSHTGASGRALPARMAPAWLAAVAVTATVLALAQRRRLAVRGAPGPTPPRVRPGVGVAAIAVAVVLVLAVPAPAPSVLALGVAAVAIRRSGRARLRAALDPGTLVALLAAAVALGTLARAWAGPARALAALGAPATAIVGALAAVCLNNLPAAALLSARPPAHPGALLVGLDLGPNLAVTGSLSAVLWLRAARLAGARAPVAAFSRLGLLVAPLTIAAALATGWVQQASPLH